MNVSEPTDPSRTDTAGDPADGDVSRSERKRDAQALKKLGKKLCDLPAAERARIPLADDLARAIDDYNRFGSHGAQRRQLQYLGKLLRRADIDPIQSALDEIEQRSAAGVRRHQVLETWRTRLLEDPAALTEFVDHFPGADVQALRLQIRRARAARTPEQARISARALFRTLKQIADDGG